MTPASGNSLITATGSEEVLNQAPALVLSDACDDVEPMIVSRQVAAPDRGLQGPCPRFGSAVDHVSNAGVHERADAHQAGLNGHVERGAGEAVVADRSRRLPYRH